MGFSKVFKHSFDFIARKIGVFNYFITESDAKDNVHINS